MIRKECDSVKQYHSRLLLLPAAICFLSFFRANGKTHPAVAPRRSQSFAKRTRINQMRTALVTGANQGIGFEIASLLLTSNDSIRVILGCRRQEAARDAAAKLIALTGANENRISILPIDLENFAVNKASAAQLEATDKIVAEQGLSVLINNAGFAFKSDSTAPFSEQSAVTTGINYGGTKNVFYNFLPLLLKWSTTHPNQPARVINVSSRAGLLHNIKNDRMKDALRSAELTEQVLDSMVETFCSVPKTTAQADNPICSTAYGFSKVMLSALTRVHAKQFAGKLHVTATCPGWCRSNMAGDSAPRSAAQGAAAMVYLATAPEEKLRDIASGNFVQMDDGKTAKCISYE